MQKGNRKIVRFRRRPLYRQTGMILLFLAVLYVILNIILYLTKRPASIYEVPYGSTAEILNDSFTGLVLRDETVYYANQSGYLSCYVREGARVSKQSTLYSIDEKGIVSSLLQSLSDENKAISDQDLGEIKSMLSQFSGEFRPESFNEVYEFKYSLSGKLLDSITSNALDQIKESLDASTFEVYTAPQTGIVSFAIDGYEGIPGAEQVTNKLIDPTDYKKTFARSNELVQAQSPIYKIVNGEIWTIVVPLTKEQAESYHDTTRVEIVFKKDNIRAAGTFRVVKNDEGYFGAVTLNKYLQRYIGDRFVDISIIKDSAMGLKIPKSSVFTEEFYLIPMSFRYCEDPATDQFGFGLEVFNSNGTTSVSFITPTVYYSTDEYCYVSKHDIASGDVLCIPDKQERYQVNQVGTLQGVYQINSGYTAFKRIEILAEASEYYIVSDKTSNGLYVYDHILLEKHNFNEHDIIY